MTCIAEGRCIVTCGPHHGNTFASVLFDAPYCFDKLVADHHTIHKLPDIEPLRQFVRAHQNKIANVPAWIEAFGGACKGINDTKCYPFEMADAHSCRLARYLRTLGCRDDDSFIYVHVDMSKKLPRLPDIVEIIETPARRYHKFAPHPTLGLWYIYVPEHINVENLHAWHMPPEDPDVQALGMGKRLARVQLLVSKTFATLTFALSEIHMVPDMRGRSGGILSDGCGRISAEAMDKVVEKLRPVYSRDIVGAVSAVHARIGSCKGMFVRDDALIGVQIVISSSQAKYWKKPAAWDDLQRTLEVCAAGVVDNTEMEEAKLNKQIIPLLEHHCGPDAIAVFREIQDTHVRRTIAAAFRTNPSTRPLSDYLSMMKDAGIRRNEPELVSMMAHHVKGKLQRKCIAKASYILPDSVWVRMVPDFTGSLRRGQCFLLLGGTKQRIVCGNVIVVRNPCFVPSDVEMWFAVNDRVPRLACVNLLICAAGPDLDCGAATTLSGGDYDGDYALVSWYRPLVAAFATHKNYPCPRIVEDGIPEARSNSPPGVGWEAFQAAQRAFYEEFHSIARSVGEWSNLVGRLQDYLGAEHPVTLEIGAYAHCAMDAVKQGWSRAFFDNKKAHRERDNIPFPPWHALTHRSQRHGDSALGRAKMQVLTMMDCRMKGLVQLVDSWALFDPIERFAVDENNWSFLASEISIASPEAGDPDLLPDGVYGQSDECRMRMRDLLEEYLREVQTCTDWNKFREEIIPRLRRDYRLPSEELASVLYAVCYERADELRRQYHAEGGYASTYCGRNGEPNAMPQLCGARGPATPFQLHQMVTAPIGELQGSSDVPPSANWRSPAQELTSTQAFLDHGRLAMSSPSGFQPFSPFLLAPSRSASLCPPRPLEWRAMKANKDLLRCLKCPFEVAKSELLMLKKKKMTHRLPRRNM